MKIELEKVLEVLALGLDNATENHRIEYLLKKLLGLDGLVLDNPNLQFFNRIKEIAQELALFVKD